MIKHRSKILRTLATLLTAMLLLAPTMAPAQAANLSGNSVSNPLDNSPQEPSPKPSTNDSQSNLATEETNPRTTDSTASSSISQEAYYPSTNLEPDSYTSSLETSSLSGGAGNASSSNKKSVSTTKAPTYSALEFIAGVDEEMKVYIANKSKDINLLKGRRVSVKLNPKALYKTKEKSSTYKVNLYDTTSGSREFVTTQNVTVSRGAKTSYIDLDLSYFDLSSKDVEIDIYDTLGDLYNTYTTTIEASNLETQTASVDETADPGATVAECDNTSFGACQLDYIFSKLQFEARKTNRSAAGYTKTRDGSYKIFYPIATQIVKVKDKYYASSSGETDGSGTGGSGGGKGDTVNGGGLSGNGVNSLLVDANGISIGQYAADLTNPHGGRITYFPGSDSMGFKIIGASSEQIVLNSNGYVGIGVPSPTAYLDIAAGNDAAPSLRLRKADHLTTTFMPGALEYDGKWWMSNGVGRSEIANVDFVRASVIAIPASTLSGTLNDATIPAHIVRTDNAQTIINKTINNSTLNNSTISNITSQNGLNVAGDLYFTGSSYGDTKILMSNASGKADWQVHDVWSLNSFNGDTVDALYIANNGKVGINDLSADYLLDVNGTLGVAGNTTLVGTLGVAGASSLASLAVTNNTTVGGTLGITGATTIGGTLAVTGNTSLANDLNTNGDAAIDGSVRIGAGGTRNFATNNGDLYVEGIMEVDGDIHLGDVTTDNLTIEASLTVNSGITANNDMNMSTNKIINIGDIGTDFTNGGGLNMNGDLAINGDNFYVDVSSSSVAINDASPDASFEIVRKASTMPFMISNGSNGDYLTVLTNGDIGINDTDPDYLLDVNGTLGVAGNSNLAGTLNVSGASTLISLGVTNNTTVGGTLGVTGATTLSSTLNAGASTLSSLTVTNNTGMTGNLNVTGTSNLNSAITTNGSVVFNSNAHDNDLRIKGLANDDLLYVNGSTNMIGLNTTNPTATLQINGSLTVTGASSFVSDISTRGDIHAGGTGDFNGDLSVNGDNFYVDVDTVSVGIGDTSPDSRLEIVRNGSIAALMISNGGTANGDYFIVAANGDVGINDSTPDYLLDVNGTLGVSDATNLASTLTVAGATTINNTLTAIGTAQINTSGNANTTIGNANNGAVAINASTLVINTADWDISNTGNMSGIGSFESNGDMTVNGAVVIGADTLRSYANGEGDLYVEGDFEVDGNIHLGDLHTDTLTIASTLTMNGEMTFNNGLNMNSQLISNIGNAGTDFTVNGGLNLNEDLAVNGNNLYVDVSAASVGIGDTSPDASLELVQNGTTTAFMISNGESANGSYLIVAANGDVGINDTTPDSLLDVNGTLSVADATTLSSTLNVSGITNITDDFIVNASALFVDTSANKVGINDASPNYDLDVTGTINGTALIINGTTALQGIATLADNLEVLGNADIDGSINGSSLTINGTTALQGIATLADNLEVLGNADIDGSINGSSLTINGTTALQGIATLADNLEVLGNADIDGSINGSSLTINGTTALQGIATLADNLEVLGNIDADGSINGSSLTVNGDTTLNGAVAIGTHGTINYANGDGDLYVEGDFEVDGNIHLGDLHTDTLVIESTLTMNGAMILNNGIDMQTKLIENIGHANTDFTVNGGLNLNEDLAVNGNNLYVDVSAASVGIGDTTPDSSLEVVRSGATTAFMISNGESANGSYLIVAANGDVGINDTTPDSLLDVNGTLAVADAAVLSSTLNVSGITNITDDFIVNATALFVDTSANKVGINDAIPNYDLDVTGTINGTALIINGTTTLQGIATLADNLEVLGNADIDGSINGSSLTINGTTALQGIATLADNLEVLGNADIDGSINGSSLTINGATALQGIATLADNLEVLGNADIDGSINGSSLTVNGDTTLNGAVAIGTHGTINYANGDGDLYVEGDFEVDGNIHLGDLHTDTLVIESTLTMNGAMILNNGIDMQTKLIENIGHANTDFTVNGGLNLNDDLAINGNNLYVDVSAASVGIGDTTPDSSLEVVRSGATTAFMISNGESANGSYLIVAANGDVGINDTTPDSLLDVNGTLSVADAATLSSTLDVSGITNITDDFIVNASALFVDTSANKVGINDANPNYDLDVTGTINGTALIINGTTAIQGIATLADNLEVLGNADIDGSINGSSLTINGTTALQGIATLTDNLEVLGNADIDGSINGSSLTINGTTALQGIATLADNLEVLGNADIDGSINGSSLTINGTTALQGIATLADNLEVLGNADIDGSINGSSLTINGTTALQGIATLADNLEVLGNIDADGSINGSSLTVNGDTTLNGAVAIGTHGTINYANGNGDLYVEGDFEVDGNIHLGDLHTDTLVIESTLTMNGAMILNNGIDMQTKLIENIGHANTDFTVNGGLNLNDDLAINGNNLYVDVSAASVGIGDTTPDSSLEVVRSGATTAFMISNGESANGSYLIVAANGDVGINDTTPDSLLDVNGTLAVADAAVLSSTLNVSGITNITDDFIVNASALFVDTSANKVGINDASPNYDLDVTGTINGTDLIVDNSSTLTGNVTAAADLTVDTTTFKVNSTTNRVGIGTNSPGFNLDVLGTANILGATTINTSGTANTTIGNANNGTLTLIANTVGITSSDWSIGTTGNMTGIGSITADGAMTIHNAATFNQNGDDFDFKVNGLNKNNMIFVDASTDRVGIGKADPDSMLHVNGDLTVEGLARWAGGLSTPADLHAGGDTTLNGNLAVGNNTDLNGNLAINGTGLFFNKSNTRMAIGENNPDATLEIARAGNTSPFMISNGAAGDGNYLNVIANGDIGINDTTPDALLDVNGTLAVTDATVLSSTLDVSGITNIIDDLIVNATALFVDTSANKVGINDASPNYDLDVTGTINGTALIINGTTAIQGIATLADNLEVLGNADIDGSINGSSLTINGTTALQGIATLADNLEVLGNIDADGSINGSSLTINGVTAIQGIATLADNLEVLGNADIDGSINGSSLTINGTTALQGVATLADNLEVLGNADIDGSINGSSLTINGTTALQGIATLADNLEVLGNADIDGSINGSSLTINGTTALQGIATLADNLEVLGNADIDGSINGSSLTINGTTALQGIATLADNLEVLGNIDADGSINGSSLTVNGDTTLNGAVAIGTHGTINYANGDGDLYIEGDFEVDGNIHLGDMHTDTLTIQSTLTMNGEMILNNGINMQAKLIENIGHANTDFTVNGGLNLNEDLAVNGNNLYVDVSAASVGIGDTTPDSSLEVVRSGATTAFMISNGESANGSYLIVAANGDVGINDTTPDSLLDVNGTLAAAGATVLSSTLNVSGITNITDDFIVNASALFVDTSANKVGINDANPNYDLDVTGTINGTALIINGTTAIQGIATLADNLEVLGNADIDGSINGSSLTINGTTALQGIATLADNLEVLGNADIDGSINGSSLTINGTTALQGIATLADNLEVLGNADIDGSINGSSLTINGTTALQGIATLADNLEVLGNADIDGSINGSSLTINGSTALQGVVTLSDNLEILGNLDTDGSINGSSLTINGTTALQGVVTLSDNLEILGNLDTDGSINGASLSIVGTTTINGATTIGNGSANVVINSNVWGIEANGDMTGIGDISSNGDLIFDGDASVANLNVNNGDITNVDDIAVSSISSEPGTSITVNIGTDATSNFTINGSTLVVEGDDSQVGIGTANPDAKLHVVGTFKLEDGSEAAERILQSDANGLAAWVTTDSINDFNEGGDLVNADRSIGNINGHSLDIITNNLSRIHVDNGGNIGVNISSPTSTLHSNGSIAAAIRTVSANATLASTDHAIMVDASGGTVTVTLPPVAAVAGRIYYIKKKDGSVNTVVIEGDGAEQVDGTANAELEVQYQTYRIQSDGTAWWIF